MEIFKIDRVFLFFWNEQSIILFMSLAIENRMNWIDQNNVLLGKFWRENNSRPAKLMEHTGTSFRLLVQIILPSSLGDLTFVIPVCKRKSQNRTLKTFGRQ